MARPVYRVAERAAERARTAPWVFINRYSRLVVDPERFPDDREEMLSVGMGAVYTRTSHGELLRQHDRAHAEQLLATHFRPYAAGIASLVDDRLDAAGRAVIVDVHSYPAVALPYELHGAGARPAICLGTDAHHTPAALVSAARQAFAAIGTVALDTPFAGCYVPMKHYGVGPAVQAIMVEIRRDTYMSEGEPADGLAAIATALTALIDAVSPARAE